jgi:hypothetical protein
MPIQVIVRVRKGSLGYPDSTQKAGVEDRHILSNSRENTRIPIVNIVVNNFDDPSRRLQVVYAQPSMSQIEFMAIATGAGLGCVEINAPPAAA